MKDINEFVIGDEEFDLICKYIKIRYESKMSQRDLAKKIGIAQSTIARMEKICILCLLVILLNYWELLDIN